MKSFVLPMALLLASTAVAAEGCAPTTSDAIAVGPYYAYDACLDDSPEAAQECAWWGPWAMWIYEESNGIAGLQRQDEMRDDTCGGQIPGDTIVF